MYQIDPGLNRTQLQLMIKKKDPILVLNSKDGWKPAAIIHPSTGLKEEAACFKRQGTTEVYRSCAITWQNNLHIIGGQQKPNQISRLTGFNLKWIGDLSFRHTGRGCAVMGNKIYLCFGRDSRVCRKSDGPLKSFSGVASLNFERLNIPITSSNSKFSKCLYIQFLSVNLSKL